MEVLHFFIKCERSAHASPSLSPSRFLCSVSLKWYHTELGDRHSIGGDRIAMEQLFARMRVIELIVVVPGAVNRLIIDTLYWKWVCDDCRLFGETQRKKRRWWRGRRGIWDEPVPRVKRECHDCNDLQVEEEQLEKCTVELKEIPSMWRLRQIKEGDGGNSQLVSKYSSFDI